MFRFIFLSFEVGAFNTCELAFPLLTLSVSPSAIKLILSEILPDEDEGPELSDALLASVV